jgi:uncharacterized iron-regulated protein
MGVTSMGRLRWRSCISVSLAFLFAFGGVPSTVKAKSRIERASGVGTLSMAQLVEEIRGARVVFVGENHGNRDHHKTQLDVIRALRDSGANVTIGLEMFLSSNQKSLDDWVNDRTTEPAFLKAFGESWDGRTRRGYRDIFEYARVEDVPMIGLNLERRVVRQVSRGGFSSVDRRDIPPIREVSCDAGEKYQGVLRTAMGRHAGKEAFVRFCEAQMLWDATMAWNVIDYLEKNPDRVMVVLAGSFHSWKHGIPERVRLQSNATIPFKVILPAGREDPISSELTEADADYMVRSGT